MTVLKLEKKSKSGSRPARPVGGRGMRAWLAALRCKHVCDSNLHGVVGAPAACACPPKGSLYVQAEFVTTALSESATIS
jgi:hypothetical protein